MKKTESKEPRGFDLDLMMHVDGELEAAEEREVASHMDEPSTRGKAAAVRELGELVRGHVELATDEAEPKLALMWTQLAKRLDNESSAAMSSTAVPVTGQGVWSGIVRWFERYRSYVLTSAVSAGAVAALALILRPATPDEIGLGNGKTGTGPVTPTFVSAPPEIESLDVPNGTGTVLTMEDEDGGTAIVWVTPDDVEGI